MRKNPAILGLVSLLGAALFSTATVRAQSTPPLPPESHQFDFWLGEWDVTESDGKPAGTSRIESIAGGAGLLENWTGYPAPTGGSGKSLNAYNAGRKQWQQFWIGSSGSVLELAGGLVDGKMILAGEHDAAGRRIREKITWTQNPDGSVRQLWEQSTDGGRTWTVAFDGSYRRRK